MKFDDDEIKRKIASGEYSISPRSGRLRKRIRYQDKKKTLSRDKLFKYAKILMFVLLIITFILSLIIVIPELNLESDKNLTPRNFRNGTK